MSAQSVSKLNSGSSLAEAELASSQVDALFSDVTSFAIGAGGVCVAALVTAQRTSSALLYGFVAVLGSIMLARLATMAEYRRRRSGAGNISMSSWAALYNFSAMGHIGVIASFCLAVFVVSSDPLDRMIGLSTILAYMAGIPGRNFANPRGVNLQILFGAIPLVVAMAVAGRQYNLLVGLLFLPYFAALKQLASRLRGIFIEAATRAHDLSAVSKRFDTALSNMSHGLAMFDGTGKVIVYNQRLLGLMMLDPAVDYCGKPMSALLTNVTDGNSDAARARLVLPDNYLYADAAEIEMRNGRVLDVTLQPMSEGGAVALVQDVTDKKRAAARIRQLALYDELTGLFNRAQFRTLLATRLAESQSHAKQALLYIDLDQFKQINDTLGHSRGDALIRCVADRLRAGVGSDVVARLGGDEFVVLHPFAGPVEDVERLAQELIDRLSEPYDVEGHMVVIGASIGIAIFPTHDQDAEQLLKKADLALYRAKADGRASFRTFETAMGAQAVARSELELDLRQAIRNDEFELFFQPIFNLTENRYQVCEALIRWRHPTRGLLFPGEFIPVAEDMGLIVDIGKWVLGHACLACATWPDDIAVAVNISPLQFRRGDIVTSVSEALAAADLPASRLELELTESVLLQDVAFTSLTMKLLHMRGVTISLDDFGTGYSSLSYMKELPLSKVKIDRSFLAGIEECERTLLMLKGLVRLCTEMGLSVVVEGVETASQLRLVAAKTPVEFVQGYLFSRPIPAEELRGVLQSGRNLSVPQLDDMATDLFERGRETSRLRNAS